MSINKFTDSRIGKKVSESILKDRLFHAYIIEGDLASDKLGFAKEMVKAAVCKENPGIGCDNCVSCRKVDHDNYEDLYFVELDGASIKTAGISELQANLRRKPMGSRNFAVISKADLMTPEAQNKLLKTLEEPNPGTVIMLLSENRENLLETIRSRCIIYRLEEESTEISDEAKELFVAMAKDSGFYEKKQLIDSIFKTKEDVLLALDGLERIFEVRLKGGNLSGRLESYADKFTLAEVSRAIELLEEARRDIIHKVNPQYALKNFVLKIGG